VNVTPEMREGLRRAVALLTAVAHDVPEVEDPEWVWSVLGDDGEERFSTLLALMNTCIGWLEGGGEDAGEVLEYLASRVDVDD